MSWGEGFDKAEKKVYFSPLISSCFTPFQEAQTVDLLIFQGSGIFREPPRVFALASVDEILLDLA